MTKIIISLMMTVSWSVMTNGQSYVKIGKQIWTDTNLDVTTYSNGDEIPEVTDPEEWAKLTTGAWCYYENNPENGKKYGKLYNWFAVHDIRGLAPKGWHIPTDEEWTTLTLELGGREVAGAKMMATVNDWKSIISSKLASNTSGFSGLPGGSRTSYGRFDGDIGYNGYWWSHTEYDEKNAWFLYLNYEEKGTVRRRFNKVSGYSVRCIKD